MKQFDTFFVDMIKNMRMLQQESKLPYAMHSLIIVSRSIDITQLRMIEESTLKKHPVTVITSMDMSSNIKSEFLQLLTEYQDNTHNPNLWLYRLVQKVGYLVICLGFMALFIFGYFYYTKNPIVADSSIIAFFVPLVVTYFGFMLVDFIDRQLLKRFKLRPNLELIVLKPKHFRTKESIIILDDNQGFLDSKRVLNEFELNGDMVERMANLIVYARKMNKRERVINEKTALWLLDD